MKKRSYTIAEAAELTGLSRKAIARRVERGSLQSLVRGGRRMVPYAELVRAGLLPADDESERAREDVGGLLSQQAAGGEGELAQIDSSVVSALVRELVERLERQAGEIAHFRALTAQAESLRLEREIGDLRARLATLETDQEPPPAGAETLFLPGGVTTPSGHAANRAGQKGEAIWLPPSASGADPSPAQTPRPSGPPPRGPGWERPRFQLPGWVRIALDVLFICAVAAVTVVADLRAEYGIAAVIVPIAVAWVIVIAFEWIRSPYRPV